MKNIDILLNNTESILNLNKVFNFIAINLFLFLLVVFIFLIIMKKNKLIQTPKEMKTLIICLLLTILFTFFLSFKNLLNVDYYKDAKNILNNVTETVTTYNKDVSFLPNSIVNTEINTFIIDNKLYTVNTSENTLYINDTPKQSYIVINEYTYTYDGDKGSLTNEEVQEILEKCKYEELKEIHY